MKFVLLSALLATNAWAQHGADVLLQKTGTTLTAPESAQMMEAGDFKLTDAYLQTLFMEWRQAKGLNPAIDRWIQLVLAGKTIEAHSQWEAVAKLASGQAQALTHNTWVYLTWKLNLPQTFVDSYLANRTAIPGGERLRFALDQVLNAEVVAAWVAENRPVLAPEHAQYLLSLTAPVGLELELAAFAARYRADHAARVLTLLPMGHPQSFTLSSTAVLDWARRKEIGEAGKLLKRRIEPELETSKNARELTRHYLTLGRLLYQAGAYEASEAFYTKVPRGTSEYIPARTERTWALLRLNRVSELRGELASLSHQVFTDRFLPEVALVRSVSNLKLCRYDDVVKDFDVFIHAHKKWAKVIEAGQANPATAKIDRPDERILELNLALGSRVAEVERLQKLTKRYGESAVWSASLERLKTQQQHITAEILQQKVRFWKNREIVLKEAIRKMKFVRIEAMSQVRMAEVNPKTNEVTDIARRIDSSRARGLQVYPADSVYWPDELFKLHSAAASRCGGKKL